jgi:hypothetical protein
MTETPGLTLLMLVAYTAIAVGRPGAADDLVAPFAIALLALGTRSLLERRDAHHDRRA